MSRPPAPDSPVPDVQVSVETRHLSTHSTPDRQLFTYLIRIENRSDETWKLLARHWDILDATGRETVVDGEGVVGEQPTLAPGATFVYDSFVTVEATPGRMGGYYVMQDAWGATARVPIPAFVLDVPGSRVLN
ncbi:Co2+/Mg2+ efflux protein ApaG [Deinococcus koreensis]|uniref:Co2+/Mg2+ efflux protein ApaG n=1 Tax=Deinococcus koreensis TaxID=2054903 RepID=A0A2K3V221_9DEIO|nr:Co2+/Mg2+ efflux protein ApaG [Deinococcus koreensis]PNY82824.1 Co2+/Mg2+ efflux protein ApaG [Deinococcus koreensis]